MQIQGMDQNSHFFPDTIDHKAIKSWADAHHHNCLSSYGIMPKTI